MSSRRTLILVGAIVVGALAALLILKYVSGIENKANSDTQLTSVLVVVAPIKQGESADSMIEQKRIDIGQRRRIDLPDNAVTRVDDIKGQVAAIDLSAGEVVTSSKFSGSTANSASRSNVLDKGLVGITMSIDPTKGVAGLVQPGDFVNVLIPTSDIGGKVNGSAVLFQKVKVLAIGQDVGAPVAVDPNASTDTTKAKTISDQVTVAVSPESAQVFAEAGFAGTLPYLVLLRPDYQPRPMLPWSAPVSPGDLPGARGLTPYGGTAAGSEAAQATGR